ncbi:MAG: hypothetical protein ACO1OG_07290 [Devosia sp.]
MKFRVLIGMLVLSALLAPAFAQEDAPVPLPRRADRMPEGVVAPADAPGTEAEQPADVPPAEALSPEQMESAAAAAAEAVAAQLNPQPVTLVARITEDGNALPDGVTWRVFETRTDAAGDLILAQKSDEATARMQLVPGDYVVHLAYGRAQITDTLTVTEGENTKQMILDAGAMRLNAAITGDVAIPINLLRFDIFTAGPESTRTQVAQNLSPSDIVTLNAGTYSIVSYFGDVNAVVRADLRVEPGQLTEATLYHKAAQVSFKLVSEAGGEAIADVDWTVKTADGQTIFTNTGAFPSTVLGEGDYLVLAKRGEQVYNREFQVQAGAPREIEVLTAVY